MLHIFSANSGSLNFLNAEALHIVCLCSGDFNMSNKFGVHNYDYVL